MGVKEKKSPVFHENNFERAIEMRKLSSSKNSSTSAVSANK